MAHYPLDVYKKAAEVRPALWVLKDPLRHRAIHAREAAEIRPGLRVLKDRIAVEHFIDQDCGRVSTRFVGTESFVVLSPVSILRMAAESRPALWVLKVAIAGQSGGYLDAAESRPALWVLKVVAVSCQWPIDVWAAESRPALWVLKVDGTSVVDKIGRRRQSLDPLCGY